MYINEALEIIKKETGLSHQLDLANELKTSQGTISNYTSGKSYPTLLMASRVYGKFGLVVEPFTETALKREWGYVKEKEEEL